ncbi:MAG: MEDS domain-containing protein [Chloroflexota bacterium]
MKDKERTEATLIEELGRLKVHDHLCLIYETPGEWRTAAVPFVKMGLERGEKCLYVVATHTVEQLRHCLKQGGVDVASAEASGRLAILHESEVYTRYGFFDPDRMTALLTSETERAIAEGYTALRLAGEMTWALRGLPGSEKLLEYEAKLNTDFFPKHPCLAICQYDRRKFDPEVIKGVILTHPLLARGNRVYHNFYYMPAEDFLNARRAEMEAQHWLNNLEREKRTQAALRESEEKYRRISSIISDIAYSCTTNVDGAYSIDWMSGDTKRTLGYTIDDIEAQSCWRFLVVDDDLPLFEKHVIGLLPGQSASCELRLRHRNGEVVWVTSYAECVTETETPERRRLYGGLVDITERKQMENLLKTVFDMSPIGMYVVQDRKVQQVNRLFARAMGRAPEQLIGKHPLGLVLPEDRERVRSNAISMLKGRHSLPYEFRVLDSAGKVKWAMETVAPIQYRGRPATLGSFMDITERKRIEAERLELERKTQLASRLATVGEMAAGIAHEINNPLTGVIGFSELLLQGELPEHIRKDLEAVNSNAQRVAGIVKGLLTFARQTKPTRSLVNINVIIQNTLELRAYHLRTNNIEVTTELDPDLPKTVADGGQLQQVFFNIIANAETEMRLAHGKGKLLVRTQKVNSNIRISFSDDGPGIPEENMQRIFEPFFTTRRVGEGTGLGLSICHGMVAEHGGKIWAESKLSEGATLFVELPIVAEREQEEETREEAEEGGRVPEARILVVDDEEVVRHLLREVLVEEGHQVDAVDNAQDALEKIKAGRYDLILLDVKMPGMSGLELHRQIKKTAESLAARVVFITGDVMGVDTSKFISENKVPHITKPFSPEQFRKEIGRRLSRGK